MSGFRLGLPPGRGATTTALISSQNPSALGQSVTFTATVTGASPTGTVTFKDGGTTLATVALNDLYGLTRAGRERNKRIKWRPQQAFT
jgi:hypothetical protein